MRAVCCICSDTFEEGHSIIATACGHVYHTNCLTLWTGQCKSCPICRSKINSADNIKLYFNFNTSASINSSVLENEVSDLRAQVTAKEIELRECKKQNDDIKIYVKQAEKRAADLQQSVYKYESEILDLQFKVKSTAGLNAKVAKLEQMNNVLTNDLALLNNVQSVVNGTKQDVEDILRESNSESDSARKMATYCSVLKRELVKVIDSKTQLLELNSKLKSDNCRFAAKLKLYQDAIERSNNKSSLLNTSKFTKPLQETGAHGFTSPYPSTSSKDVLDAEVDISPLSAPFTNLKFNMCIGSASSSSSKYEKKVVKEKKLGLSAPCKRDNDENSVIRTGYNGLGGHSNVIKGSGVKSLKRKL